MYVTEDTVRAHPDDAAPAVPRRDPLRRQAAVPVRHRRPRHADRGREPGAVRARGGARERDAEVELDWHGHCDRGLAVINTIAAIRAGATRVHGCAIGIGERVGNTPMDQLLVNLRLLGWIDNDLTRAARVLRAGERARPGCRSRPTIRWSGRDAFRTGTGVHAAAVIKAFRKGEDWLADRVYSGVPGEPGRAPPGDRGRADERREQRDLLARAPRDRAHARARAGRVPAREERGSRAHARTRSTPCSTPLDETRVS